MQKIFVVAEKYFCLRVEKRNIRYINKDDIVKSLMNFSYIKDFFQNVVVEAELEPFAEVVENTLQSTRIICES